LIRLLFIALIAARADGPALAPLPQFCSFHGDPESQKIEVQMGNFRDPFGQSLLVNLTLNHWPIRVLKSARP
jgi:hypothetical protein